VAFDPLPAEIRDVADVLRDVRAPWAVAGGWAIDLALGRVTRPHADVDVAVFRADQAALRAALPDWAFEAVAAGERRPWPPGVWLAPPVHEVYATPAAGAAPLEVLLNERDGADWVFRRDAAVRRPLARAIVRTAGGLPALAPEVVLLYKAKAPRPADALDFAAALPQLGAEARAWLAAALTRCHPGHAWLPALGPGASEVGVRRIQVLAV
jgi:hypothetical protein